MFGSGGFVSLFIGEVGCGKVFALIGLVGSLGFFGSKCVFFLQNLDHLDTETYTTQS